MKKKSKILWVSDINPSTGFGQVSHEVITRLNRTGAYDFVALGINYRGGRHEYNFHVYPTDSGDVYGTRMFPYYVQEERPDLIFMVQDPFVIVSYMAGLEQMGLMDVVPTVGYFPIDGNSVPTDWLKALKSLTVPIAYSQYAKNVLASYDSDIEKIYMPIVYHGISTNDYRPLRDIDRETLRKKNNISDRFVVGVVNRYQPRKQVPLGVRAFSLFRNGYKVCQDCHNYYQLNLGWCDLCFSKNVERTTGPVEEALIYLHMEPVEPLTGGESSSLFKVIRSAGISPEVAANSVMLPQKHIYGPDSPTREEVVNLYNMLDCYVATDCGEGFGLTQMEALSCGIPVIKSDNTVSRELLGEHGIYARNCGFFTMGYDSGHFRPVVHIPAVVDAIESVYKRWLDNGKVTKINWAGHEYVKKNFNWDTTAARFHEEIQKAFQIKEHQRKHPVLEIERV